jgi:hypothetical protein
MRKILSGFVLLLIFPVLQAQQPLDNSAVIKLAKAGLSDDLIVTTINASPGNYDISADGLIALKAAKVSDKVVAAIVAKASGAGANAGPAGAALGGSAESESSAPFSLPGGINGAGVYLRDRSGAWVSMLPEIVTFHSANKIEDIATAGILKSDLDGRIEGSHSRVKATLPVIFAVYVPEGVEITEYVLFELHAASKARTFLYAAGGLLHTQAGAHEDQIDFQPEKLAPRLYQIVLPVIEGSGEYGLLGPGTRKTSSKEASGKIYTVSAAE